MMISRESCLHRLNCFLIFIYIYCLLTAAGYLILLIQTEKAARIPLILCLPAFYLFFILIKLLQKLISIYQSSDIDLPEFSEPVNTSRIICLLLQNLQELHSKQYEYLLLQKQAQLDAMQSQIQPHFLYNALDSIRGLAFSENAMKTAEMAESLSIFYRNSIGRSTEMISLEQELKNVENYVKIQRYRFGNRFEFILETTPQHSSLLHSYRIPKLTIQPVVENAIYHGIDRQAKGGVIRLSFLSTQSRLIISVKDNGQGMDETSLLQLNETLAKSIDDCENTSRSPHTGIALTNINSRIKMIYGTAYGLTAYSAPNLGSEFQIILPLTPVDWKEKEDL